MKFKCQKCSKSFKSIMALRGHGRAHSTKLARAKGAKPAKPAPAKAPVEHATEHAIAPARAQSTSTSTEPAIAQAEPKPLSSFSYPSLADYKSFKEQGAKETTSGVPGPTTPAAPTAAGQPVQLATGGLFTAVDSVINNTLLKDSDIKVKSNPVMADAAMASMGFVSSGNPTPVPIPYWTPLLLFIMSTYVAPIAAAILGRQKVSLSKETPGGSDTNASERVSSQKEPTKK